ncbi:MAG: hypothetical protein ABI142_05790 [Bryocella sp.]
MKGLRILVVIAAILALGTSLSANAQQASCKKHAGTWECNWQAFHVLLDKSRTLAVHNSNVDRFTGVQLKGLAKSLGKSVVEQNADLHFYIRPVDSQGFVMGPGDTAIAELSVYSNASMTDPIWVEDYYGEPDRPWASSVHALIERFQDRLKSTK